MNWPKDKAVPVSESSPEQRSAQVDHDLTEIQRAHARRVRKRIERSRDNLLWTASRLAMQNTGQRMSGPEWKEFTDSTRHAAELEQRAAVLRQIEEAKEARAEGVRVVAEPRTYAPDSPHSYFRDLATVTLRDEVGPGEAQAAEERLGAYDRELAYEVRRGSKEGQRAVRALRESCRDRDEAINQRKLEERGITTGGGATASAGGAGGAAFVSPYFLIESWAPFRGTHRTFADQCDQVPLPPYGMEFYVPAFTSTSGTSVQTEGSGVTETDPAMTFQSGQVGTAAGLVTISQQLSDRGATGGGSFDVLIGKQLQQQLDATVNLYALNAALTAATAVTGSSTFSIANLYADLAKGREVLTDTTGTRLKPTHVFTTGDLYSYVTRQVDATTNRPIVTPMFAPGFPITEGDSQAKWSRFTGTVLPGGVLWFEDDTLPPSGSDTPIVVSAPEESVVLAEGEPVLQSFPQTDAATLQVVVRLHEYVAAVPRYPAGTAEIVGAAYTTSLV